MKVSFFNGGSGGGSSSPNPKIYRSVVTNPSSPSEIVLRNDFGSAMSFTWTNLSTGVFRATGIYNFLDPNVLDKLIVFTSNSTKNADLFCSVAYIQASFTPPISNTFEVRVSKAGGSPQNEMLQMWFEIRQYD
tara:strand:- start:233 stop:631 length:399 start_codon:yes stop_codon:yes gene_type:complete